MVWSFIVQVKWLLPTILRLWAVHPSGVDARDKQLFATANDTCCPGPNTLKAQKWRRANALLIGVAYIAFAGRMGVLSSKHGCRYWWRQTRGLHWYTWLMLPPFPRFCVCFIIELIGAFQSSKTKLGWLIKYTGYAKYSRMGFNS